MIGPPGRSALRQMRAPPGRWMHAVYDMAENYLKEGPKGLGWTLSDVDLTEIDGVLANAGGRKMRITRRQMVLWYSFVDGLRQLQ